MSKLEFDDEQSQAVEEFNASAGATARRAQILQALSPSSGERILDVGSGPGHQAFEMAHAVGTAGRVDGVDVAETGLAIARQRCAQLPNVAFHEGDAFNLPFEDGTFDGVMSSQVFEYLDDVPAALAEIRRVLRPGGRVLIHDTDWGATLWHSSDPARMARVLAAWDAHLADPHLPRSLGRKLRDAGFERVKTEPFVQLETSWDSSSASAVLMRFIGGYVVSQGISQGEIDAWGEDLRAAGDRGTYFYSSNEYIFTACKPAGG